MDKIGILEKIQYTPSKGSKPIPLFESRLHPDYGMEGDYHGIEGDAELIIWSAKARKKLEEKSFDGLCFQRFKENLSLSGSDLEKLKAGDILQIGDALLAVLPKKKSCHRECHVRSNGADCLLRSEVRFVAVLKEGMIKKDDPVYLQKEGSMSFTHFNESGEAIMVDVTEKNATTRTAVAEGCISVSEKIMEAITNRQVQKGDVLGVARVAGILAVKKTSEIIPMCHPLLIGKCSIDFEPIPEKKQIKAICTVKIEGKTGVEMEALHGVSAALLTIYDMCKAIDKSMVIENIHLVEKSGGKSGDFRFDGI